MNISPESDVPTTTRGRVIGVFKLNPQTKGVLSEKSVVLGKLI